MISLKFLLDKTDLKQFHLHFGYFWLILLIIK